MKRALAILLALVVLMGLFVGCGSDSKSGKDSITGVYKLDTVMGMSLKEFAEEWGMGDDAVPSIQIELKNGGKFTMAYDDESVEGDWELSGETLTMTVDNEPVEATLKDGIITMSDSGMEMTFKK